MAGRIPQPFIDELIHRSDIIEFIDGYVPLKKQGRSYVACCPFHNEKTPSFNVVPQKQFYHCFGCGASGNVVGFAMNYLSLGFPEAVDLLAARVGLEVPKDPAQKVFQKKSASLYDCLEAVNRHYQSTLKKHPAAIAYLKQRGISGHTAKDFELGFVPEEWHFIQQAFPKQQQALLDSGMLVKNDQGKIYDRYRQRIMFPIRDRNGRMIGFGGRAIANDQKPKYLNSPETAIFQKNRELYGLHQALQSNKQPSHFIIVEGYMDVIALAEKGIRCAVAALGTATSSTHIQLLSRHCKQLYFCFDGDQAGRQAAWRALENSLSHMNGGIDARFAFLPEGEDPDSFVQQHGADGFQNFLQQALPFEQFFIQELSASLDLSSLAGQSQLFQSAKPYLANIGEGPFKEGLMDMLSRRTHVEKHRIAELAISKKDTPPHSSPKPIKRTPIRLAIALLLQHPDTLKTLPECPDPVFFEHNDSAIIAQLIRHIISIDQPNTARLLEHFRTASTFEALQRLAAWEHMVPEETVAQELQDVLSFLQKKNVDRQINQLLERSRQGLLDTDEKTALQQLLKAKAGLAH